MWNDDPDHVIHVIPDFTKPDIKDQWNQARQLEDAMVAENLMLPCARVVVTGVLKVTCKLV